MQAETKKKFTVLVLSNEAMNEELVQDLQTYCFTISGGDIQAKDIIFVSSDPRDPLRQYADLDIENADVVLRFMWEDDVKKSVFQSADLYRSRLLLSLQPS